MKKPKNYFWWGIIKTGENPDQKVEANKWRTRDLKTARNHIFRMAKLCCFETKYFDYHNKIEPPERFWSGWRFDFGTPDFYGYAREAR